MHVTCSFKQWWYIENVIVQSVDLHFLVLIWGLSEGGAVVDGGLCDEVLLL